jgi:hypothetical protein
MISTDVKKQTRFIKNNHIDFQKVRDLPYQLIILLVRVITIFAEIYLKNRQQGDFTHPLDKIP